jgi:hypothetical protein
MHATVLTLLLMLIASSMPTVCIPVPTGERSSAVSTEKTLKRPGSEDALPGRKKFKKASSTKAKAKVKVSV